MNYSEMDAETRIKRARIQLYKNQPFFGHLVQHLTLVETERVPTAGVDPYNRLYYNPEFVESLSEDEVEGLVSHEVMHLALESWNRQMGRDGDMWNVAQDTIINHILSTNGMDLPENGIIPENGTMDYGWGEITDLDEESCESVYDFIKRNGPEPKKLKVSGFDEHMGMDGDGQGATGEGGGDDDEEEGSGINPEKDPEEQDDMEVISKGSEEDVDWDDEMEQAAQRQEQVRGERPAGMEGRIEAAHSEQVDWRRLIRSSIAELNPYDFTFTKPHKNSYSSGYYQPKTKKRSGIKLIAVVDTSGSVSDNLLSQFIGEIVNIIRTFNHIELTVMQHDADVQDIEEYNNPRRSDFESFDIKGRGGTSHVPVFEEIENERMSDHKTICVCLTDGFTQVPEQIPEFKDVIWVLNNYEIGKDRLKHGKIARIDPYEGN